MLDLELFADSEELFDGQYKLLNPLSTDGGTADVWLALDTNTLDDEDKEVLKDSTADWTEIEQKALKVAIKVYRPRNALDIEGRQLFTKEFKIVFNCNHTNLLHPTYFGIFREIPYLVLPFCQNGSSELLIGQFTLEEDLWKYIHDVASGLAYLHANDPQIIHQDVKPANVLIDDNRNYAITDFGISATNMLHSSNEEDFENSGTKAYMAPERFSEDAQPIPESDIWGLGATLYELITGHVPYGEDGGENQPAGDVALEFPKVLSPNIQRLVFACLDYSPAKRPTAAQLILAAQTRTYPANADPWPISKIPKMVGAFCIVAVITVLAYLFLNGGKTEESEPLTKAEVYIKENIDNIRVGDSMNMEVSTNSDASIIYQSSDPSLAKIDSTGRIVAVKAGTVDIIARVNATEKYTGASDTMKLTIEDKPLHEPVAPVLKISKSQYTAKPNSRIKIDVQSNSDAAPVFSSSNEDIATVDKEGNVITGREGTTTITVTVPATMAFLESSATTKIVVKEAPVPDSDPTPGPHRIGDYAIWKGKLKNGNPDGVGKLTFTKSHIIPGDPDRQIAKAGDYLEGTFNNGYIKDVDWFGQNGEIKKTICP